jgi:hypothetical protein
MQAEQTLDLASQEQSDQDIAAEASVTEGQIVGFESVQELTRQGQFMLVLVAFDVIQERATGQAEDADQLEEGETAQPRFWERDCGYRRWFLSVSGAVTVVPSMTLGWRPNQVWRA